MTKICEQHKKDPCLLYTDCVECEIEWLRDKTERLEKAIRLTLSENMYLADGDNCTLIHLKNAIWEK